MGPLKTGAFVLTVIFLDAYSGAELIDLIFAVNVIEHVSSPKMFVYPGCRSFVLGRAVSNYLSGRQST